MKGATINLVPIKTRQAMELRHIIKGWVTLGGTAVISCVMICAVSLHRLRAQQARVDHLALESEPTVQLMSQTQEFVAHQAKLDAASDTLSQLVPTDDLLQTMGVFSLASVNNTAGSPRLRCLRIALGEAKTFSASQDAANPESKSAHVTVSVSGSDEGEIQAWLDAVRNHPRVYQLRIRTSSHDETAGLRHLELDAFVLVEKELPR